MIRALYLFFVFVSFNTQCNTTDPIDPTTPLKLLYHDFKYTLLGNRWRSWYACPSGLQESETEKCTVEMLPTVYKETNKCRDGTSDLYIVNYEFPAPSSQTGILKKYYADLYTFCFNSQTKETVTTRHTVSSVEEREYPYTDSIWQNIQAQPIGGFEYDLENVKTAYEMLLKDRLGDDHLIPELLVPSFDLEPDHTRGLDLHFFNVRALWKSKQSLWKEVSHKVWEQVRFGTLLPDIKTSTKNTMFTFTKNNVQINVQQWWYKRVVTVDYISYDVYVLNVPSSDTGNITYNCKESVCKEIDIEIESEGIFVQCCKA